MTLWGSVSSRPCTDLESIWRSVWIEGNRSLLERGPPAFFVMVLSVWIHVLRVAAFLCQV